MGNLDNITGIFGFILKPRATINRLRVITIKAQHYEEIQEEQPYYWLYQQIRPNTTLIDIGANIGDTVLYFGVNCNVKKIIAFEPVPVFYEIAKSAIKKIPFSNKVVLHNKAVTADVQKKLIKKNKWYIGDSYEKLDEKEGIIINSVPLRNVLKNLKNVAIKCDCEGAENTMFDNANLSNVYVLQVEYHNSKDKVTQILKSNGFYVKVKKAVDTPNYQLGFIYATRLKPSNTKI